MAVELNERTGNEILEIQLTGSLSHADYERFTPVIEQRIREHGKLRLLVHLHDFHGWTPAAVWDDIQFDARHFRDIERLAIVGENAWQHGMAVFCKPFTRAEIRYFEQDQLTEARAWLQESDD